MPSHLPLAPDGELRKHGADLAVLAAATDPILARNVAGGVDNKLLRRLVIRGGGLNAHDIGAVAQFGHAKAAWQAQVVELGQKLGVVARGAQLGNRAAAQRKVHAGLDAQRVVGKRQRFEGGHKAGGVYESGVAA